MHPVRFRNPRGLNLAGQLYAARSDALVVFAHGFTSDKSSRGRFERLARRLNEAKLSCLAFDFAGCGDSDDDTLTMGKHVEDLAAAVDFAAAQGYRRLGLYGHSLGALICLRAWSPRIATMVLSGALTGPMRYDWSTFFTPAQLRGLAETGQLTLEPGGGLRRRAVIEGAMLEEFAAIDPVELLGRVRCPVLIIHGDADEEERALLERTRAGMARLPAGSRLEVVPGANHSFYGKHERLCALAREWFVRHFVPR